MEQNKTSRYFKYAIGEIILVVIGILIALSINNWNESRIQKRNALDVCQRLLEESNTNIEILKSDVTRNKGLLSADLALLNMMGDNYKTQSVRQLDSLMSFVLITPKLIIKNSVLNQTLNDNSIMNVVDEKLKNNIYDIPLLLNSIKTTQTSVDQFVNDQLVPLMSTTYSIRNMDAEFSPSMKHLGVSKFNKDSRKILAMFHFENILDNKYYIFNNLNTNYTKLLKSYESLSKELETNIDLLKN